MTVHTLVLTEKVWPGKPLNVNDQRGHSRNLAHLVPPWRDLGIVAARAHRLRPIPVPVLVLAEFRFKDNRKRDTANLYPTVKALLDGIVLAGVLPGDDDGRIVGPWLIRSFPNGPPCIRLTLRPMRSLADAVALVRGGPDGRGHPDDDGGHLVPPTGLLDAAGLHHDRW